MTYAPTDLLALRSYLARETGLSAAALGIVGDTAHNQRGVSYHLGADDLRSGAYSATTARDRAGLSNAASAIDIGNFPRLRSLSIWLVSQGRTNAEGTRDIREIIYSPDGTTVLRWDRERGYRSLPRSGEADNSHRTHTHVSYYRDSRARPKVPLYARYFEDDLMADIHAVTGILSGVLAKGAKVYDRPGGTVLDTNDTARRVLLTGRTRNTSHYQVDGGGTGAMRWVAAADITATRDESYTAGIDAAIAAVTALRRPPVG